MDGSEIRERGRGTNGRRSGDGKWSSYRMRMERGRIDDESNRWGNWEGEERW